MQWNHVNMMFWGEGYAIGIMMQYQANINLGMVQL